MENRTLPTGSPADAGMDPQRIERVRRLCAGWVQQGVTSALQVAVVRRGVTVLQGAWGRLGPEAEARPLTNDSIFGITSTTKAITAAASMCLVEDGLLGLNRPVQEYVPEFVGAGKEGVMVHHLLTHTSGFKDDALDAYALDGVRSGRIAPPPSLPSLPGLQDDMYLAMRCFDAILDSPLTVAPGTEMSYCNYGYCLLAEIVTRVSGRPVDQLVQERILGPLGMASTSFAGVPAERLGRMVRRPPDAPFAWVNYPEVAASVQPGTGSAYASARDMAVFFQMFLNGGVYGGARILSPATVREMTRDQIPGLSAEFLGEFFPEACWGYGWGIQGNKKGSRDASLLSPATFSHSGGGMNYAWADPALDLVGVYMTVAPRPVSARRWEMGKDLFVNAVTASVID